MDVDHTIHWVEVLVGRSSSPRTSLKLAGGIGRNAWGHFRCFPGAKEARAGYNLQTSSVHLEKTSKPVASPGLEQMQEAFVVLLVGLGFDSAMLICEFCTYCFGNFT